MGTPYNSFSRARDRPGGPPTLRSNEHHDGLPGLAPDDKEKIRCGNILARFSITVSHCCAQLQVPATIENPESSRLWKLKSFQNARLTSRSTWTTTDFCQDGTPWRKRTAFLATQLNDGAPRTEGTAFVRQSLIEAAMRTCDGRATCTRSHRPHQFLRGIQPSSGRYFTIVAEPYPGSFAAGWSKLMASPSEAPEKTHGSGNSGVAWSKARCIPLSKASLTLRADTDLAPYAASKNATMSRVTRTRDSAPNKARSDLLLLIQRCR